MTKELITSLKGLAAPEEIARLTVTHNATKRNLAAYNEESSTQRLNNLRASEEELAAYSAELKTRYLPAAGSAIQAWVEFGESKSKAEILRQLQGLGYEITQRTFYRHCTQGKCRPGKGGLYTRRLVKAYVEAEGLIRHGEEPESADGPSTALSVEKQRLENRKLELHNLNADLEYKRKQKLLIEREALYLELAARIVAIDNGFMQMIEVESPTLIASIGGEMSRQPEFVSLLRGYWNDLLNSFSTTEEIEVLFEEDEPETKGEEHGHEGI